MTTMADDDRNKEEKFLSQHREDTAKNLSWACLLGAAIMIGFLWQDTLMSASGYKAINIRLFGALPISALAWYLSRSLIARRFISYISAFFWLSYACFTAAIFIIYEPGPYGLTSSTGLGSFLLILFGVFAFSNLRFWASLLVGLLILLVYTYSVTIWTQAVFVDFILGDFLTALALLIGAATKTLFTDRARRQQFETSEQLSESYNTIEQQVRERTSELTDEITTRKQAEKALKENENKYRWLANNVADVIFVLDMNFNFTYISPSVEILMGYEPEELLKQPTIETTTPSSWNLVKKTISEIIELEESEHAEISISQTLQLEMIRKDGTTVWMEVKASFIRDENHQPVSILGVARDITERKLVESQREVLLEDIHKINETLEQRVNERTVELNVTISQLEEVNRAFVGRELKMVELKNRIAELEKQKT
jgi:PAS domain S-box-containing protein